MYQGGNYNIKITIEFLDFFKKLKYNKGNYDKNFISRR